MAAANPPAPPSGEAAPAQSPESVPTKHPRAKRYSCHEDGHDYHVLQILPPSEHVPAGTLVPIPEVPRFASQAEAKKFILGSGEQLAGHQVTIIKECETLAINVETKATVNVNAKPRHQVTGPK